MGQTCENLVSEFAFKWVNLYRYTAGLPIIATNWSGPTEFMTPENSYPLSVGLHTHSRVSDWLHRPHTGCHQLDVFWLQKNVVEKCQPCLSVEPKLVRLPADHVFKKHYWAQPSVGHLRGLMRRVVEAPEEAAAKGAEVGSLY
jgi:hypothetical protein